MPSAFFHANTGKSKKGIQSLYFLHGIQSARYLNLLMKKNEALRKNSSSVVITSELIFFIASINIANALVFHTLNSEMRKYKSVIHPLFSSHLITKKKPLYFKNYETLHILRSWETHVRLFAAGSRWWEELLVNSVLKGQILQCS